MNKIFQLVFATTLMIFMSGQAQAKGGFFSYGGETVIKVQDFPDTPQFKLDSGAYMDAGYIYKQLSIMFVPVWNYDGRWVGYIGSDSSYVPLKSEKALRDLAKVANVTLPATPKLPFWDAIGGKLVLALGFMLLVVFGIFAKDEEVEEREESPQQQVKA